METQMGREIRRVPPKWEHPQETKYNPFKRQNETGYRPMYDKSYREASEQWRKEFAEWEGGKRQKKFAKSGDDYEFWDWDGMPPNKETYRPDWKAEEMTWFQVYETVSEGTPVTPPFATKQELIDYLVEHGDFWDQLRGDGGWKRENAVAFVEREWAPSMMVFRSEESTTILSPRDGA